jgi:hypothetical protein
MTCVDWRISCKISREIRLLVFKKLNNGNCYINLGDVENTH